jgi:hypothetical protein
MSVLDDGEPNPWMLGRLAAALDLHRSDLFVIAGRPVPGDLAPLDATAASAIGSLAWSLTYLPGAIAELHRLVQAMPRLPRPPKSRPSTPTRQQYPDCAGALVVRLLHNRNLDWTQTARYLFGLGNGALLSASTIGLIAHGRKALSPELLTGFVACLDLSSRDLSALTGIDLTSAGPPVHPDAAQAAALIWNARYLTAGQLRQVQERAHAIRHERANKLEPALRCHCTGPS